jgi:Ca2+-binding EF-hand superfamily protein
MKTLVFLALALASLPAFAGGDKPPEDIVDRIMTRLDADHDGRISRKEAETAKRLATHFDRIDADKDGYLSRAEITAAIANARARHGK